MKYLKTSYALAALLLLMLLGTLAMAADDGYQIGTGDVVKITVYGHPDLTTVARVDDYGSISFPLLGEIVIGGQTAAVAAQTITSSLNGDYIVSPQVTVFIEEFRSKKVVISGEVVRPGLYELTGPTTIMELISKAGGLTKGAGRAATVHRSQQTANGQAATFTVNLGELLEAGRSAGDLQLMDGDSVTVAKAGVVYVTGQVNRPAAYNIEPDMTVIKAVTLAGGFTPLASQRRIKIIRKIAGNEQVIERVSLHERIAADDVMVIPESFF